MDTREYRCCMCPQLDQDADICPTGPGKKEETQCIFAVTWADARGWKYKVMAGLGESNYKGRYQDDKHEGRAGWKGMRQLQWQNSFDKAQEDLNRLATSKGWKPIIIGI